MLNMYPPYLGAGVRANYVAEDWSELHVQLKVRWYNRNFFGTHFGGSLYSMVDPHLCLLLTQRLGRGYIVWDQAAEIDFVRATRKPVSCHICLPEDRLDEIRRETESGAKYLPEFELEIKDDEGVVARIKKILYVRKKK